MIGFDRPLKPEWIYELLKIVKIGDNPSNYNKIFENIAKELIGKEGKRKARTIIYRSFIYSFQEKRNKIENNIFLEWVKVYTLNEIMPLFLAKILIDHKVLLFIIEKMKISFDGNNNISTGILTNKMVKEYGDRDIVKRSVRAFLKTLCNFGLLKEIDKQKYRLIKKFQLNDEQLKNFIILYATCYLKSDFVDLENIDKRLLYFFHEINFHNTATKFNRKYWEYIRDGRREILLLKSNQLL